MSEDLFNITTDNASTYLTLKVPSDMSHVTIFDDKFVIIATSFIVFLMTILFFRYIGGNRVNNPNKYSRIRNRVDVRNMIESYNPEFEENR